MASAIALVVFSSFIVAVSAECRKTTKHYRPVVIVHGLHSTLTTMDFLTNYIRDKHPGTEVYNIKILVENGDYLPMWYQVFRFNKAIAEFVKTRPGGIDLIGFSQGGLIARGILHTLANHSVHTFISLGGPQAGYHGDFFAAPDEFFNVGNEQRYSSSISGFFKDPTKLDEYYKEGRFLATLNNETFNPKSHEFKENFLKIKKLIAVGGPDDDVMVPWQTTIFGFEDENKNIVPYDQQQTYLDDSYGLRTLDERGGLQIVVIPHVFHSKWHDTPSVLDVAVVPFLER